MPANSFRLPQHITSLSEVHSLVLEIEKILDVARHHAILVKSKVNDNDQDVHMSSQLSLFFETDPDIATLESLRTSLELVIDSAPRIRITLSASPPSEMRLLLTKWFRDLHPHCLIEFLADPSIVGGIIVRTNRHIYTATYQSFFKQNSIELMARQLA